MLNGAEKSKEFLIIVKEIMNKPSQEMKKELNFKEITNFSINFETATIKFEYKEEEKPALKVEEWISIESCMFKDKKVYALFSEYGNDNKGFGLSSVHGNYWCDDIGVSEDSSYLWKPADMQEVKKLLIKEAEKSGFKDGVKVKSALNGINYTMDASKPVINGHGFMMGHVIIFSFESGKWAEIVEKKPLYVNQYGTEFFEGDQYYFVLKETYEIDYSECLESGTTGLQGDKYSSEIMTRRECHRYLDEHWDELNK